MRRDAFTTPAPDSQDWFTYLRKNLNAPQKPYYRFMSQAICSLTEEEDSIYVEESFRLVAVARFDYPPDKKIDWDDRRIKAVLSFIKIGLFKLSRGGPSV